MLIWRIGSFCNDFIESGYGVDGGGSENKFKSIVSYVVIVGQFEELIWKWGLEMFQFFDVVQVSVIDWIVFVLMYLFIVYGQF